MAPKFKEFLRSMRFARNDKKTQPTRQNVTQIFEPSRDLTPFDQSSVTSMRNFNEMGYQESFPALSGLWAFGTLEKGIEHLEEQKLLGRNTDYCSQQLLIKLEMLYMNASAEANLLYGEKLPRRYLSKSEEVPGPKANPSKALDKISKEILWAEFLFHRHQQAQFTLFEGSQKLNEDLLQAIEQANKAVLMNTLGDYYGALCKDFRDCQEWQMPKEDCQKWAFMGFTKYSDIIEKYDAEQDMLRNAGDKSNANETPLTNDLEAAYKFLGSKYSSVDEIVQFMRSYAERCVTVHPVKDAFDEGDAFVLQQYIIRDYQEVNFLGNDIQTEQKKEEIRQVLDVVKKVFFDHWSEVPGKAKASKALDQLREMHESEMKKTVPFFGKNAGFEKHSGSGERGGKDLTKGQIEDMEHKKESNYQEALDQCAGEYPGVAANPIVGQVLVQLKEELERAKKDRDINASTSELYYKNWVKSMDNNKDKKKQMKAEATAKAKTEG